MENINTTTKKNILASIDSRYLGIIVTIVAMCAFFASRTPTFISPSNLHDIILDGVVPAMMAIGLSVVMASGGFDMSIAAVTGTSAMVCAIMMRNFGIPIPIAVIVTLAMCVGIGSVNGLIVIKTGVTPFITTLAMQFILFGARAWLTGGRQVSGFNPSFIAFSKGSWFFSVSNMVTTLIITVIVFYFIMNRLKFGRYMSAVGNNIKASGYSGINVPRYTMLSYIISSAMCGLAGIMLLARNNAANVGMADSFLIKAITIAMFSAVIFTRYNSVGIFLASFVVSTVAMGVAAVRIDPDMINLITGLIMMIVIIVGKLINSDEAKARKAKRQMEAWEKANAANNET